MAIRHYVLLATDGFINVPTAPDVCTTDEVPIYVFGFAGGLYSVDGQIINPHLDWTNPDNWPYLRSLQGVASIPAPLLWADVGDHLYVTLINLGMKERPDLLDFHTVHLHGAHVPTQTDGFPELSFGVPVWEVGPPPNATYFFAPDEPGTLMYHCHVEASEHIQMGMYGALVVYPSMASLAAAGITRDALGRWYYNGVLQPYLSTTATNRNFAYNNIATYYAKEYVLLCSDIDSVWHDAVLHNTPFNAVNYKPDFWLVNGRAFPDTLRPHPQTPPPGSNPNLLQITYESYVRAVVGTPLLFRTINLSYQSVPWHIHGTHFNIVGKDAALNPIVPIAQKLGLNAFVGTRGFTVLVGSGESFDLSITFPDKRAQYWQYIARGQDGFPSLCSQMAEIQSVDPGAIFQIPTQPVLCPDPATTNYIDICTEPCNVNDNFFPQFFPMHNHDDYKVTNNGVYPGGQLTYIEVDAPIAWPATVPHCRTASDGA